MLLVVQAILCRLLDGKIVIGRVVHKVERVRQVLSAIKRRILFAVVQVLKLVHIMCTLDIPVSVPLETDSLLGHLRLSLELAVIYALLHYRFSVSAEEVLIDG